MFEKSMKVWSVGLILAVLAAACASPPTPDPRLGDLEAKVDSLAGLQTELASLQGEVSSLSADQAKLAALQDQLDALQAQVDGLASGMGAEASPAEASHEEHPDDPFGVSMAQYVLDTAGFHGMAETISETHQVDPAYLGTVTRVHKILSSAPWPESLAQQGNDFITLLGEFAAALEADDADAAARLSDEVHDAQHELSHAIDAWLGAGGEHEH